MFVPFTKGGELAKRLKEAEDELGKQTGFKIVKKTANRLVDLLHKSNPWQGKDCHKDGCLICSKNAKTGKGLDQDCTKYSIVFKTWCKKKEEKMILKKYDEEEKQREEIKKIKLFKYIRESSRSSYERGLEHL